MKKELSFSLHHIGWITQDINLFESSSEIIIDLDNYEED